MKETKKVPEKNISRTGRNKPVIAIDGWGREEKFASGREAARQLGLNQSGVNYVLTGQRVKCGGFRFRYAE